MHRISIVILLLGSLLIAPSAGFCGSGAYYRGYDDGYAVGLSQGAADAVEDMRYTPYSYKYFKELYMDKTYSYRRGFKNGYRRGYKDAYRGDVIIEEEIIEERIIVE